MNSSNCIQYFAARMHVYHANMPCRSTCIFSIKQSLHHRITLTGNGATPGATDAVAVSLFAGGVLAGAMFRFNCRLAGLRPSFVDLTPGGVSSPPRRDPGRAPHKEHGGAEQGGEDGSNSIWKYFIKRLIELKKIEIHLFNL